MTSIFKKEDVEFKTSGKSVKFSVTHNLSQDLGLSFNDALKSWLLFTKEFTAESLCSYIMSKNLELVLAFVEKDYDETQGTLPKLELEFTINDFINPLSNKTEEVMVYYLDDPEELKCLCKHDGIQTIVFMNDLDQWVGNNNIETPLTKALGSAIERQYDKFK